jgi:hypothetical protein
MLGAFLTPELSDRLLPSTEEESYHGVENHWLLRKSAASAFAQGYFQILLYKKPKVSYSPSLSIRQPETMFSTT